jgi:hypothetical protein
MKKCKECGELKPLDYFYHSWATKDRRGSKCKECLKKYANKHRADNLESCQAYDRERANMPHRIELRKQVSRVWVEDGRHAASQTRYREKYPDKYTAHNILNAAKRDGKILIPRSCSACGVVTKDLEAHHDDYLKPLEVRWLCISCHSETRRTYTRVEEYSHICTGNIPF